MGFGLLCCACGTRKCICICNANVLSKLMAVKNANRCATIDSGLVLCFGLICDTILMMDLIVFVV